MPIYNLNFNRCYSKMSEDDGRIIFKLENTKSFLDEEKSICGDVKNDLNLSYDHVYTVNNRENGGINLAESNCHSAESEVKFWKDWIILHLDLIQQQNNDLLNKERTILILQQENEMLKERLNCMERGTPFQPKTFYNSHSFLEDSLEMTQDTNPCDEGKNCLDVVSVKCENGDVCGKTESHLEKEEIDAKFHNSSDKIINSVIKDCDSVNTEYNFTVTHTDGLDPMKNLKMSIRRKRLSNSSGVCNSEFVVEEKRSFRKVKKRRKRIIKDSQILTTPDLYITEINKYRVPDISNSTLNIPNDANLEVPRWRIKVYASCYAMEGTENLDDEVYNKRHSRLENDERRRKRWDVQRIREQRLIERLKQRQERSCSRIDEQNDSNQSSLWSNVEDIKFIEVSEELPISAFGSPIPQLTPSEFHLPWLSDPNAVNTKKVSLKKSSVKKKSTKR